MSKKLVTIQVREGSFVLTPAQLNAVKRCVVKWESLKNKKLKSYERWKIRDELIEINLIQLILSDLKRLIPTTNDKENSSK